MNTRPFDPVQTNTIPSNLPSSIQPNSALTPEMQALLAELEPIASYPLSHWWPLADGWKILIILAITALITGITLLVQYRRRARYKQQVDLLIQHLRALPADNLVLEANRLLKRAALAAYPSSATQINQAFGKEWVSWLNNRCPKPVFMDEQAQALASGHYNTDVIYDRELLIIGVAEWFFSHMKTLRTFRTFTTSETKHV